MRSEKQFMRLGLLVVFFVAGFLTAVALYEPAPQAPQVTVQVQEQPRYASILVPAVTDDGVGIISKVNVELRPGKGRALIYTNPFVEPDTQYSIQTAMELAAEYTGKSVSGYDAIYSLSDIDAQLVGGPSAGAAFTIATIAAVQGKKVRQDVTMSGTVSSDGSIGNVTSLAEKVNASAAHGIKIFLVPKGQARMKYDVESMEGEYLLTVHRVFDLVEHGEELGVTVIEVASVDEAVQYFLE